MKSKIKISAISVSCLLMMSLFTGCGADMTDTSMTMGEKSADKNSAEIVKEDSASSVAEEVPAEDFADAEMMADGAFESEMSVKSDGDIIADEPIGEPVIEPIEEPTEISPEAGLLTAGEWNDNDNWGFFQNLVNSNAIEFPVFNINPVNRAEVNVKNESGEPSVNAKVEMLSADGSAIWTSITDKDGKAYLFYETDNLPEKFRVSFGETSQEFEIEKNTDLSGNGQGSSITAVPESTDIVFSSSGELYPATDIMFIMDSTGSMSDEMLFLQSEFSAIANETGTDNVRYSVNFYRDEGDDYVTKCFDFTNDISEIQQTLNNERADGGGDTPEAVTEILDETMNKSDWGENSVKLAFMIFDAPPHSDRDNLDVLNNAVKTASEKGIRIIPVVSSNSERNTELFGRALSICTNGTYVFLTDDSGVGDSHLEPIIGDYEVEKLYDIIIRVINEYRQ
ncbi:MAG: vWA domain-containing protein [Ruminococcus sp.]|nr:VWA domain-containing protein [Oscillospiraceae bacterium]MDY4413970.1 vWA domain-containing protein [Ruminococcus sp.]